MTISFYNLIKEFKIVIPIIQRDYAQGRETGKVPAIRNRFIDSIKKTLLSDNDKMELDFIYGYTKIYENEEKVLTKHFIPLDGQQRLTTLFLLHWFLASREERLEELRPVLQKFSYETRHSSNVFCKKLVDFNPGKGFSDIKKLIVDQPWFFTAWHNDPTISSMLTVLQALEEKFYDTHLSLDFLISENPKIVFHLLPMEKLGLPDDLYIKMNSRGKELTEFEYFKSQFTEVIPPEFVSKFKNDVDQKWSDLFWDMHKDLQEPDLAKLADRAFLRFYNYISDILLLKNNIERTDIKDQLLNDNLYKNPENVRFLFDALDALCNPDIYFSDLFYLQEADFSQEKVRLFFDKPEIDLLRKCAAVYNPQEHTNPFSLGEQLMLYAYLQHIVYGTEDFNKRLRILRNLIANSEDTVRIDNLGYLVSDADLLIKTGIINPDSKFNTRQIAEENLKSEVLIQKPHLKEVMHKTEDHRLLRGALSVFDFDDRFEFYADNFRKLFSDGVDYKTLSHALLITADYSQLYSWRWRVGTRNESSWRELLTPSNRRQHFDKIKNSVHLLIDRLSANPATDIADIVVNYKMQYENEISKPKDWIYYYIVYDMFDINLEGFLYWSEDHFHLKYDVMRKTSLGGSHWSPYLYVLQQRFNTKVTLGIYGEPLILTKKNISVRLRANNDGYYIEENFSAKTAEYLDSLIAHKILDENYCLKINKFSENEDLDDRIIEGEKFIKTFFEGIA
ncbi:Protein of uncharacterised function DUF262 [Chryseobacterium taklimakanense]|uniref:Protein of uncharacterized function DUF262 n=1 Tax=Chryseobacterium taklimakanense TaxID=536441 RepID=A0A239WCA5_9FLAO|nr:DUF262 domain-containing protein [Chryseobacterium taklimakanense]SNV32022.1 Protein of uncharacterised function DUF262 [Chryseobacterium taklimakanense]